MRFLPVVGAGAFLSYTIYARLRLAALVAEMNGHDSEDPEVQGLLFFSILPGGEAHADIDSTSPKAAGENHDGVLESPKGNAAMSGSVALRAARGLGHGLARQVLQRSTGWRSASDLYDLAAAICSERESEEAGPQTCTVQRAQLLFQPSRSKHPVLLLLLAFGALAPLLVALASLLWRWCPRLGAGVLLSALLSAIFWRWELVDLATEHPQWVTSLVLMIHALLPLFAAFSSTRLIVEGLLSRHSMAMLATESGSGLLFLLLGAWTWLRLWQRMQADGDGSKGHSTAMLQRALLGLLLAMGTLDLFGVDAFAFHSVPAFGTLRSSHWFVGVLQVQALECQLQLLALLKQREVLLRLLGATHMMGLAVLLFLGGVTASVGFLVSRQDFLRFVDGLAPPPKITAAIVMLRRERSICALALGGAAGVLWQLPQGTAAVALVTKMGGMMPGAQRKKGLGATAAGLFFSTFEEFRTALLEPSGGRWLMVFPETSEKAKTQASEMWSKLKFGAAGAAAEKGAIYIGHGFLDSLLNYLGTLWVGGKAVEKIVEAKGGRKRVWFLLVLLIAVSLVLPTISRACYLTLLWIPVFVWQSPTTVVFALQKSGPVFIKLGQWLSTRRDIIRSDICDAMGELHEHVPASGKRQDLRHAEQEIPGLQLGEWMGGGCVAQVYHGEYQGQSVAVKVRRSGITRRLEMDLRVLHGAARLATMVKPRLKWMALEEALDNFKGYMLQQVNLSQEAEYMRKFDYNFRKQNNILVPETYAVTESVLVMGIAAGKSLSTFIKEDHSREKRLEVHAVLTDMMAHMAIENGFLHGDLHPGNLFIDLEGPEEKPIVTLIDTGISITMSPQLKDFTKEAITAAFRRNAPKMGKAVIRLHERENLTAYATNMSGLDDDIGYLLMAGCWRVKKKIWSHRFPSEEAYNGTKVSQYFNMLMEDLSSHQIRVAPDLWSIMTAFALIEGSIEELGFGVNVMGACIPYIVNKFNPFDWVRSHRTLEESDQNSRDARGQN
eukprot:symbB.v1.2.018387.t2/scaffold1466.1/size117087/3